MINDKVKSRVVELSNEGLAPQLIMYRLISESDDLGIPTGYDISLDDVKSLIPNNCEVAPHAELNSDVLEVVTNELDIKVLKTYSSTYATLRRMINTQVAKLDALQLRSIETGEPVPSHEVAQLMALIKTSDSYKKAYVARAGLSMERDEQIERERSQYMKSHRERVLRDVEFNSFIQSSNE